jgi:hypothetical protein
MAGWIEIETEIGIISCMAGWIETEIISSLILNNFITAILMYFTNVLDWTVYENYCFITLFG